MDLASDYERWQRGRRAPKRVVAIQLVISVGHSGMPSLWLTGAFEAAYCEQNSINVCTRNDQSRRQHGLPRRFISMDRHRTTRFCFKTPCVAFKVLSECSECRLPGGAQPQPRFPPCSLGPHLAGSALCSQRCHLYAPAMPEHDASQASLCVHSVAAKLSVCQATKEAVALHLSYRYP